MAPGQRGWPPTGGVVREADPRRGALAGDGAGASRARRTGRSARSTTTSSGASTSTRPSRRRWSCSTTIADARPALAGDEPGERALASPTSTLVSLVQPFAPHIAEELWGGWAASGCGASPGRRADERLPGARHVSRVVVQVNGKLRGRWTCRRDRRQRRAAAPGARARPAAALTGGPRGRARDRRARQARQPRRALRAASGGVVDEVERPAHDR